MAETKETTEKPNEAAKKDRRRIRKIQLPARPGRFKRSLIEKVVKEVIAERSLQ